MGNGIGFAGGYTPVPITGSDFPIGVPAMAPIGTTTAPSVQAATQAAVNTGSTTGGSTGGGGDTAPTTPTGPMFNPVTGENLNPTFFQKGGMLDVGLGALQTLGNLWNSFQQIKLAKEQFSFQKQAYTTNLANQEKTYNTSLEARTMGAAHADGVSQEQANQYVKDHSL